MTIDKEFIDEFRNNPNEAFQKLIGKYSDREIAFIDILAQDVFSGGDYHDKLYKDPHFLWLKIISEPLMNASTFSSILQNIVI